MDALLEWKSPQVSILLSGREATDDELCVDFNKQSKVGEQTTTSPIDGETVCFISDDLEVVGAS